jgi:hypothetical protein
MQDCGERRDGEIETEGVLQKEEERTVRKELPVWEI